MSGLNKVMLIGNLGKDPEYRHLEGGLIVARFSLATSEYYKNKDGVKTEHVEWHHIVIWRELAELAERIKLRKGQQVFIEGKIRYRSWQEEGVKKSKTEIVADSFQLIGKRDNNVEVASPNPTQYPPIISFESDLPF